MSGAKNSILIRQIQDNSRNSELFQDFCTFGSGKDGLKL